MDPDYLDEMYDRCISDLTRFIPEGFQDVHASSVLKTSEMLQLNGFEGDADKLHHNFFVMESQNKLTLFNQKFIIWIAPEIVNSESITYCLVALNKRGVIKPEIAFKVVGLDNRSDIILQFLEEALDDIDDNERELSTFYDDDSHFSM